MMKLGGTLSGAQEVPPVSTSATGRVDATFDRNTNKLSYTVTHTARPDPRNSCSQKRVS